MKFWVDYIASMVIEAKDAEEAENIFYQVYQDETREYSEVTCVSEIEEEKE